MSTEREPVTPPAVSPSPVAPGPAVPPEGREGQRLPSDGFLEQIMTQARELSEAGHAWMDALKAKRPDRRLYNKFDALCANAGRDYMVQVPLLIAEIKRLRNLQAARREAGEIEMRGDREVMS